MAQRRRRAEQVEVRLLREDEPPVLRVEQRRQPVAAQLAELVGRQREGAVDRDRQQHDHQRRQETASATGPELHAVDRARRRPFAHQQARDEVTGQHEERVDAEEPAARPPVAEVVCDHGRDRERSEAVEGRLVGEAPLGGRHGHSSVPRAGPPNHTAPRRTRQPFVRKWPPEGTLSTKRWGCGERTPSAGSRQRINQAQPRRLEWRSSRSSSSGRRSSTRCARWATTGKRPPPTRPRVAGSSREDRDNPGHYLNVVFFDSYDEAMKNSNSPTTQKFSEQMMALADGPPTFYNLDVVEDRDLAR